MGRILHTTTGKVGMVVALGLFPACDDGLKTAGVPPGMLGDGGLDLPDAGPPLDCTQTGPDIDADGDRFSPNGGDCDDCEASVGPNAHDVPGNGLDEDCKDGDATALDPPCDEDVAATSVEGEDIARSLDLCRIVSQTSRRHGVIEASLGTLVAEGALEDNRQIWLPEGFGSLRARSGSRFVVLSTGVARDPSVEAYTESCDTFTSQRTGAGWTGAHAPPAGYPKDSSECDQAPSTNVAAFNSVVLTVTLRAPANASAFTFDSIFFTYEYPYFVCDLFNDFFAVFADPAPRGSDDGGNVLFDENDDPIGANSGLLQVCRQESGVARDIDCELGPELLAGTGYDRDESTCVSETDSMLEDRGGASTGWLRTTVPINASELMTLHFVLWDSGDPLLDSTVVIDNFQWVVEDAPSGAVTTPIAGP
jgi:hypothetical protein